MIDSWMGTIKAGSGFPCKDTGGLEMGKLASYSPILCKSALVLPANMGPMIISMLPAFCDPAHCTPFCL